MYKKKENTTIKAIQNFLFNSWVYMYAVYVVRIHFLKKKEGNHKEYSIGSENSRYLFYV